jgi:hypothetical protein
VDGWSGGHGAHPLGQAIRRFQSIGKSPKYADSDGLRTATNRPQVQHFTLGEQSGVTTALHVDTSWFHKASGVSLSSPPAPPIASIKASKEHFLEAFFIEKQGLIRQGGLRKAIDWWISIRVLDASA